MAPFLDTAEGLSSALPHLAPHARIAVDTEADSLHCYFEKLCLIQISVPGYDCLIDPLAGFPLQPLFEACDGKEIILHGADYDLRLMRRVGYAGPTRVFDTMIGARLCGIPEFSLAALINKYFDVQVTKASQKANWARRPLSPQMMEYAVNDTRHLAGLADILSAELDRQNRRVWFDQLCDRAIRSAEIDKEIDPDQLWRVPGSGHLRGRAAAIFRELWKWRDGEARRLDKPTFHICHSDLLVQAAVAFDAGDTFEIHHLRGPREKKYFEAAKRGVELPEEEWPKFIRAPRLRPTPAQLEHFDELKRIRDKAATEHHLDPSLIAPKATLEGLAFRPDDTLSKLLPWQRELMGL